MYGWVSLLFTWNHHKIVNWLYSNTKQKSSKAKKENKLSVKKLLKRGTWEETTRWSHSTRKKFTFSLRKLLDGRKWRLNKPHPGPISQHFGSDQESLTRMQATSPAGCRQPGTGNSNHSHTDITEPSNHRSLAWGIERLQNTETVLPAQVCTKPHTPDDHRSEEGILHFKLFKRYSFFPGSSLHVHNTDKLHLFCCPHLHYDYCILQFTCVFFEIRYLWAAK